MAGVFKKIAKGILIGGGTILSLFNPAIGAPLIVAGTNINTGTSGTSDMVSAYGTNLNSAINQAATMQGAQRASTTFDNFLLFLKNNLVLVLGVIAAGIFLPKLFKSRR
jgi:hypothetical protein